jgi:hypothetical protein
MISGCTLGQKRVQLLSVNPQLEISDNDRSFYLSRTSNLSIVNLIERSPGLGNHIFHRQHNSAVLCLTPSGEGGECGCELEACVRWEMGFSLSTPFLSYALLSPNVTQGTHTYTIPTVLFYLPPIQDELR